MTFTQIDDEPNRFDAHTATKSGADAILEAAQWVVDHGFAAVVKFDGQKAGGGFALGNLQGQVLDQRLIDALHASKLAGLTFRMTFSDSDNAMHFKLAWASST